MVVIEVVCGGVGSGSGSGSAVICCSNTRDLKVTISEVVIFRICLE